MAGHIQKSIIALLVMAVMCASAVYVTPAAGKTVKEQTGNRQNQVVEKQKQGKQQVMQMLKEIKAQRNEIKSLDRETRILQTSVTQKVARKRASGRNLTSGQAKALKDTVVRLRTKRREIVQLQKGIQSETNVYKAAARAGDMEKAEGALGEIVRLQGRLTSAYGSVEGCLSDIGESLQ